MRDGTRASSVRGQRAPSPLGRTIPQAGCVRAAQPGMAAFQVYIHALELLRRRSLVFLPERVGERLFVEEKAFGYEERVLLLARVEVGFHEFFERFFLVFLDLAFPHGFLEAELV